MLLHILGCEDGPPQGRINHAKMSAVLSLSKPCLSESKMQLLVASERKMARESCSRHLQSPRKQIWEDPKSSQPEARNKVPWPPCATPYRAPPVPLLCSLSSDLRPSRMSRNDGVTMANVTNHFWQTPIGPVSCSWAPNLDRIKPTAITVKNENPEAWAITQNSPEMLLI